MSVAVEIGIGSKEKLIERNTHSNSVTSLNLLMTSEQETR